MLHSAQRAFLLLLLWTATACAAPPGPADSPRPSHLSGATLTGEPFERDLLGSWTLLVFWASWCEHCRHEAPDVEALHTAAGPLQVLGVSVDRDAEAASGFARTLGLTFPTLLDPELELADAFEVDGTPTLVLVDPGGTVVARSQRLADAELQAHLAALQSPNTAMGSRLQHSSDRPVVARHAALMGTDVHVLVLTEDHTRAQQAIDVALDEMRRIETLMTDWTETSQVAAIGHAAGQHAVAIDKELYDLLSAARDVSELTEGKFDVTWAGASGLWDFRADPPQLPEPSAVATAVQRVDYTQLELDPVETTAFLRQPDMRVGLGAVAKGYAVDRAIGVLARAGFRDYAVNAGGDLAVRGRIDEELWWVSIRDPRDADAFLGVLPASNVSVVTSGDYERYFELDGVRYCHIIDPDTGWPAQGTRSVTVMATRTWWADALATGVFVLGVERGLALIESLEGVEGLIVDGAGAMHVSSGLAPPQPSS